MAMRDIVERLRKATVLSERVIWPPENDLVDAERREAADEIERLQAVVDAARGLIEYISYQPQEHWAEVERRLGAAIRALDGEPSPRQMHRALWEKHLENMSKAALADKNAIFSPFEVWAKDLKEPCPTCGGSGEDRSTIHAEAYYGKFDPCPNCNGAGRKG